jgi:hypothetical protein
MIKKIFKKSKKFRLHRIRKNFMQVSTKTMRKQNLNKKSLKSKRKIQKYNANKTNLKTNNNRKKKTTGQQLIKYRNKSTKQSAIF